MSKVLEFYIKLLREPGAPLGSCVTIYTGFQPFFLNILKLSRHISLLSFFCEMDCFYIAPLIT